MERGFRRLGRESRVRPLSRHVSDVRVGAEHTLTPSRGMGDFWGRPMASEGVAAWGGGPGGWQSDKRWRLATWNMNNVWKNLEKMEDV